MDMLIEILKKKIEITKNKDGDLWLAQKLLSWRTDVYGIGKRQTWTLTKR